MEREVDGVSGVSHFATHLRKCVHSASVACHFLHRRLLFPTGKHCAGAEAVKKSTMLLVLVLGAVVILYFCWPGIRKWWKEDGLKSNTSQSSLKPEPPQAQPVEADLPLDSKGAAVACGTVLKLDKTAFGKLHLITRLSQVVDDSGFTDAEVKVMDLQQEAFNAYSFAYITWDKPKQVSRATLDKILIDADRSVDKRKFSSAEQAQFDAYMVKYKHMKLKAFDLGRHDARTSPCPY